ncbi:MAG: MBL fold metallo-hydrolase [Bryobacteraceae bacterium]|nr:MBL fold metallo-hydrolase [Bryobacteraceae bacterium]
MKQDSRRGFLKRSMAHLWTGAALLDQAMLRATAARAQAKTAVLPTMFDLQKVAPGVFAAIAKPLPFLNCNAAIFENEKDLLIVDSHARPSAVVSLVQQLKREVGPKPVRYVVNSHFHWDHSEGNGAYKQAFPNAQIVTTEITRNLLREFGAARAKAQVEQAQNAVPGYQKSLAAAKTPEEKAYWQLMVQDSLSFANEMKAYTPELPNLTLETDLIIHDKAHDLHLAFRGKGHTAGDVVVFCPQKKVLATGDLLHGFAPFIADGFPRLWPATLRTVAGFDYNRVIGGHGAVQDSKLRGFQKAAYLEELAVEVGKLKKQGVAVQTIQKQLDPSKLKSLSRDGYGEFLMASLSTHLLQKPGANRAQILSDAVAGNIADVYKTLDRA